MSARTPTRDALIALAQQEAAQQEADHLIALAQQLEQAAKETRRDATAIRAHMRGLKPGEAGLRPTFGYAAARNRLYHLRTSAREEWPEAERMIHP